MKHLKFLDILTKDFLLREYSENKRTTYDIGVEVGVSDMTIAKYLRHHGLEVRKKGTHEEDLVGQKFNHLRAVRKLGRKSPKSRICQYECLCDCGNTSVVSSSHLRKGVVKSCGCIKSRRGSDNPSWKGGQYLSASWWASVESNARNRGLEIAIDLAYAEDLLVRQNFCCALSGVSISENKYVTRSRRGDVANTASLDRIDNEQGYIPGNVQWVHKDINKMKHVHSQQRFVELCESVADYQRSLGLSYEQAKAEIDSPN